MAKVYDTTFREMFSRGLPALLPWLLPGVRSCEVLKEDKDLATTSRWPDLMLRITDSRLHRMGRRRPGSATATMLQIVECQCQPDPTLSRSMLTRAVLAHDLHDLPVRTTVLVLAPAAVPPSSYVYGEGEAGEPLRHSVTVRHVFAEPADGALRQDIAALLPLVTVMQPPHGDRASLLEQVVTRILERARGHEPRSMLLEQAAHFATLRLSRPQVRDIVQAVLRRKRIMIDPLRDFPLVRDGYDQGKAEGKAEGTAEGRAESVLTILQVRGVRVSNALRRQILACTDQPTLERWLRKAVAATTAAEVIEGQASQPLGRGRSSQVSRRGAASG